ncbi:melatonin receptor type 1B-B-like [Diadema antillarum]|uniref:melatonin receptor type 1B-B-like n=1 Tax=Diadema antillarum TaxID=105358 RepID=UPI003A867F24
MAHFDGEKNTSWTIDPSASPLSTSSDHPSGYVNFYPDEKVVHMIVLVWTAIILVCGSVGNILVIAAVLLHKNLRNVGNVFIVNLAVADLSVSTIVNSFGIVGLVTEARFFIGKGALCQFVGVICITCCACSMWTIAAIGLNRYVCICHWPRYHTVYTRKTVVAMVAAIWILSFLIDLPNLFGWGLHNFDWKTMLCTGNMSFRKSYTIFFSVTAFILPLLVILYAYARIYWRAWRSAANLKNVCKDTGTTVNRVGDMRLARSVSIIIVVFVLMWAPYALSIVINFVVDVGRNTYIFSILLAHTNSCVNCFIYAVTNRNFRQGYSICIDLILRRSYLNSLYPRTKRSTVEASVTRRAGGILARQAIMPDESG